jgi:general secretion pathway protein D
LDGIQDSSTVTGIPGLVNIPILGKVLFGSDHTEKDRQQLMIALVPHIVRTPDYTPENLRGIYSGPDQSLRLMYAPRDEEGSAPAAPAPGATAPAPQPPAVQPAKPAAPAAPGPGARIVFTPGSVSVGANTPFAVNVELNGATDASTISPLRVKWDPAVLRLTDITPGDLLSRGGAVSSIKDIRNDAGEATRTVARAAGPGVTGSGPVAILNFVAVARGTGAVTVTEMGLKNSQALAVPVTLGSVSVAVQ